MNNKSVIIVGAGASNELGLPTGAELKQKISSLLNIRFSGIKTQIVGDKTIERAIYAFSFEKDDDYNQYISTCLHIRDALPQTPSIDNFIDLHRNNEKIELCGKLAIVRAILEAEASSKLFTGLKTSNAKPNFPRLETTWLNKFWQLLTENCQIEDLGERFESIGLVVFNYDRCIEQFLFYSLQNVYGINENDAAQLVNTIDIFHPYGVVGNLPWQKKDGIIAFGEEPEAQQLLELANQIRTFTEGTDPDSSEIESIQWSVSQAEMVLFLGFAFHKLNMQLIMSEKTATQGTNSTYYFATAIGVSDSDIGIVENQIKMRSRSKNKRFYLRNDKTCSQIFDEYWRMLTLY